MSLLAPFVIFFSLSTIDSHPGTTVAELRAAGQWDAAWLEQLRAMCRRLYPAGWNIDYYPTNFIPHAGALYYIDYECSPYSPQGDLAHWGV